MADYLVTTDFKAHDMVSPTLRAIEAQNNRFAHQTKRTFSQVFKGSFMGTMGANLVTSGLNQVRMGVMNVVEEYKDFDTTINQAAVKFGNIDYGSEKFKEIGAVAREVGRTTKFTAGDAAGGLMAMAGAGFEAENALKLLAPMANFAAAAKMDLAEATEVAGGALNAFSMNSKDAAVQSKNLTRIADVMAEADRMSMASMQGLSESVAWGATDFTTAGQSIESFMAIAAGLADVKKTGSVAGTILRGMAVDFATLSNKGKKSMEKLAGPIDWKGPVDFIDVLKKMEPRLKNLSDLEKTKVLSKIFDRRVASGISAMFTQGIDKIEKYRERLEDTSGTAKRAGDQLNQSLTFRVMALQNAFQEKGFQIFEKFLTDGRGGIESMIEAVNKWDIDPIADALKQIAKALAFAARHTDDLIRIGKAFLIIKGATMAIDGVRWLRQLPGIISGLGASAGWGTSLGAAMRGGGMVPSAMPFMPPTPAQMGGGGPALAMSAPQFRGRHDNFGAPVSIANAGKLSISSVANVAFAAGTAGVIGYQLGDLIRSNFIDPLIDDYFKAREDLQAAQFNLRRQLEKGTIDTGTAESELKKQERMFGKASSPLALGMGILTGDTAAITGMFKQAQNMREITDAIRSQKIMSEMESGGPTPTIDKYKSSIEQAMRQIDTLRRNENLWYDNMYYKSDKVIENHEGKIKEMDSLYESYMKRLEDLNEATREAAAQGGSAVVTVHVEGPGAGNVTTKTSTKGPKAPSVDVSKGGPN